MSSSSRAGQNTAPCCFFSYPVLKAKASYIRLSIQGNKTEELHVWSEQGTEPVGRSHSLTSSPGRQESTHFVFSLIWGKGNTQWVKPAGLDTYSPAAFESALGFLYFKAILDSYKFSRAVRKRSSGVSQWAATYFIKLLHSVHYIIFIYYF